MLKLEFFHQIELELLVNNFFQKESLSLLLIDLAFDGVENLINNLLRQKTRFEQKERTIKKNSFYSKGIFCRYTTSMVIIAKSNKILTNYIKPILISFLFERGLHFEKEEVDLFTLREKNLNFLGHSFKYRKGWIRKNSMMRISKQYVPQIILVPNISEVKIIKIKLKKEFQKAQNTTASKLISKLNIIIKDWCVYFKVSQCYSILKKLEQFLYKRCWLWIKKKHPKWDRTKIVTKYFKPNANKKYWNFYRSLKMWFPFLSKNKKKDLFATSYHICKRYLDKKKLD